MNNRPDLHKEPGRGLLVTLFAAYLLLLTWAILWKLETPWIGSGTLRQIKLLPFATSASSSGSHPLEVIANLLLFVPFGLYIKALFPALGWWRAASLFAGSSLLLESAQFAFAIGLSDITDVILNTAGGLVGMGAAGFLYRRLQQRTTPLVAKISFTLTCVALVAATAFHLSPMSYAQKESPTIAWAESQETTSSTTIS